MSSTKREAGTGRAGGTKLAVAAAAMSVLPGAGCSSNALPPIPVPTSSERAPLPRWYGADVSWSGAGGDSRVYVEGKIVFDTDRATIRASSEKVLNGLLKFLGDHPELTLLRVEGHTDALASDEHNQELSARRALAVCDWLVDHGVDNTRLLAIGFGKTRPIAPNERAEGRQENRRTEFHVAEMNGRPFLSTGKDPTAGGMVLIVKSKEEREHDKRVAAQPRAVLTKTKERVPTGDELRQLSADAMPLKPRGR